MTVTESTTVPQPRSSVVENVDVLIVGAGVSGIGAAHHLRARLPREVLRRPGGAGRPRRHLVDPPLPRRPLGQRPVHLRLPVQAVARAVDRGGRGDPRLPRRGHRGERPAAVHPLPPPGHRRELVERGPPVDGGGHPCRHRRAAAVHHRLPAGCARATTTTPSPTSRSGRAWTGSGAWSSTRSSGRTTSTTAASASSSSAPAPPRRR